MLWKKRQVVDINQVDSQLDTSFKNVRQDIYNIFSWLNYLNDRMVNMQKQLDSSVRSDNEIKRLIDTHNPYGNLPQKLADLHEKMAHIEHAQRVIPDEIQGIRQAIKEINIFPESDIKRVIDAYNPTGNLSGEIAKMTEKIAHLTEKLHHIENQQNTIPEEMEELKSKLRKITDSDERIAVQQPIVQPQIAAPVAQEPSKLDEINERLKHIEDQRKKTSREAMVRRITRNSKSYVKTVIVSLIKKYQRIPALKLKEMVVDEQGLCSKSSFYRLLNEVQEESEVSVAHKGKEKEIVYKTQSQIV